MGAAFTCYWGRYPSLSALVLMRRRKKDTFCMISITLNLLLNFDGSQRSRDGEPMRRKLNRIFFGQMTQESLRV
jgi:hypothetical protein